MNKVVLVGNITQDIELRTTASGIPTCSFGLAVGRSRKNKDGSRTTDFITIVAWRHTAEYCAKEIGLLWLEAGKIGPLRTSRE